jgi:hypothetical protein
MRRLRKQERWKWQTGRGETVTIRRYTCRKPFAFPLEEQERFARLGYHTQPKYCPECRQQRNAIRQQT